MSDAAQNERMSSYRELTRQSAHEIRNALNAVAVNLEVARSRLERSEQQDDAVGKAVAPFARSAAEQLEVLGELTEAYITQVRCIMGEATGLEEMVRSAVRLANAIARMEGGSVSFEGGGVHGTGNVSTGVASWVVVRLLLDAIAEGAGQSLSVGLDEGPRMFVRVDSGAELPGLQESLVQAAESSGVQLTHERGIWTAQFTPSAA